MGKIEKARARNPRKKNEGSKGFLIGASAREVGVPDLDPVLAIGFANFLRSASVANALTNGDVFLRTTSSVNGIEVTSYRVRVSPNTEEGSTTCAEARTREPRGRAPLDHASRATFRLPLFHGPHTVRAAISINQAGAGYLGGTSQPIRYPVP